MDLLMWLQLWYASQCNGDWEHGYGIEIETVDNPGWHVSINLTDTTASGATMPPLNQDHGDDDWIFCKVENGRFEGAGDPSKLTAILEHFRELVGRYDPHSAPQGPGGPSAAAHRERLPWRRIDASWDEIDLLPADLRARSVNDREIVLRYPDVLQAIDLLEAAGWALLGWEGWLHYADGTNGFAWQFPGLDIDRKTEEPWDESVRRSAAACRSTIEAAQQRWRVQPERSDAELYFCLTAADRAWVEGHSARPPQL